MLQVPTITRLSELVIREFFVTAPSDAILTVSEQQPGVASMSADWLEPDGTVLSVLRSVPINVTATVEGARVAREMASEILRLKQLHLTQLITRAKQRGRQHVH